MFAQKKINLYENCAHLMLFNPVFIWAASSLVLGCGSKLKSDMLNSLKCQTFCAYTYTSTKKP